jgi:drug/metabolite transporter (DMT)-like permease
MVISMCAWGGSWVSAKVIAGTTQPEVLIFWRFLVTFVTTIPVMFIFKQSFGLSRKALVQALIGGALMVVYNKFFFWGLHYGFAGAAGVLVTSLNPVLTFIIASIAFKRRIHTIEIIGLALGLTGGMILLHIWEINNERLLLSGNLFFLMCSLAWAVLSTVTEKAKMDLSPIKFSFYVYGFAVILDLLIALPYDILAPLNFNFTFWFNICYLAIFATTFATTVYFKAANNLGAHKASSFIFLVPVSAVLLSWTLLGEKPQATTIIGGLVAISAVYLINSGAVRKC